MNNNEFYQFKETTNNALIQQINVNRAVHDSLESLELATKELSAGQKLIVTTLENILDIIQKQEAEIQILKAYISIKEGGEWK